jgi:hypothetical protein
MIKIIIKGFLVNLIIIGQSHTWLIAYLTNPLFEEPLIDRCSTNHLNPKHKQAFLLTH